MDDDNDMMGYLFNNYKQIGLFIMMFVIVYVIEVITHRNNILYGLLIPYVAEETTAKTSKIKKKSK